MQNLTTSEWILGLVLVLPFISFILSFLIPERYAWLTSISASIILLACTVLSFILFFSEELIKINIDWFQIGTINVNFNLLLDNTSRLMVMVVSVVSFLIHLYSAGYMAGDSGIRRYFAMLGFFTFSMLGIVLADQFIVTFMFWELMGFSSYILIGHWMEKPSAAKAAQKAFLYNRIGDALLLVGMLMIWTHPFANLDWTTAGVLCIFGGVIGKSAQLPLSSWLPDAMEGPTPVSALLHAATMVAAGIFLLIRMSPMFTETSLIVITIIGSVTALYGAVCALNQFDIKKILAYSTISQLGLMVTAIGIGAKDAALLHLFTHAFFKAGLFLAAGSVIHALTHSRFGNEISFDVQDIRTMGGLRKKLPVTFIVFCIAGASLAGIPLFSGFISKDSILSAAWLLNGSAKWTIITLILVVSFCTVLYTYRLIRFVFLGHESAQTVHESPWVMRIPMIIFAAASCWLVVSVSPFGEGSWFTRIFPGAQLFAVATIPSIAVVLVALVSAAFIYAKPSAKSIKIVEQGFGLDSLYQKTIGVFFMKAASATETTDKKLIDGLIHVTAYAQVAFAHGIAWFDRFIIDGIVNAGARITKSFGGFTRSFQSGKIQLYIFWAMAGLIIFLFFALI